MLEFQPSRVANILAFAPRSPPAVVAGLALCLTPHDRMDLTGWRETARLAGYDRMVIHEHDAGDTLEFGNFLSVYCRGDAWSRWGFVRCGAVIRAWCCLTGVDVGEFDSLSDALDAVLTKRNAGRTTPAMIVAIGKSHRAGAVVTPLATWRKQCHQTLGSAA